MPDSELEKQLYHLLRAQLGDYFGPDQLCQVAGTFFSSVQQALVRLEQRGAPIECHPALGYRLAQIPDVLLPCELSYGLETRCFGQWVRVHQEVGSTNDEARQLVEQQAPEGALVLAESQRQGRGRRGRTWHSPPHVGLWCSLLVYPHEQIPPGFFTMLFGVALARTLRLHYSAAVTLKWPNDILLDDRKVAGILCEFHASPNSRPALIAGFGINVNQKNFPPALRSSATSIFLHTGHKISRSTLLKKLLQEVEQAYICAASGGEDLLLDQARRFSSTLGRQVLVKTDDQEIRGLACDLDASGALILEDHTGARRTIHAGDVHHSTDLDSGEIPLDSQATGS